MNHYCILVLRVVTMMRLRDRQPPSRRPTRYSPITVLPGRKVTSTGSAARRQSVQRFGRVINRDRRELERERDQVGGEGFADLIHWQDGNAMITFKRVLDHQNPTNHKTSTRCEPSGHTERAMHDDIVAPRRGMCGKTAPDDYVRNFLSSLRPNLEGKIQEFKTIGLDSKNTLDAFIQWQASEREGWIFSQNPYLQLTPLELSGLMLGIERLSDGGNGA